MSSPVTPSFSPSTPTTFGRVSGSPVASGSVATSKSIDVLAPGMIAPSKTTWNELTSSIPTPVGASGTAPSAKSTVWVDPSARV